MKLEAELSAKMRARANADKLATDHPLRTLANEFDDACDQSDPKRFMGAWARARRVWCEHTGEPLL